MEVKKTESLDSILEDFTLDQTDEPIQERHAITIWVSKDVGDKYEKIQTATRKKFSKKLKKIVTIAIGSIPIDEAS